MVSSITMINWPNVMDVRQFLDNPEVPVILLALIGVTNSILLAVLPMHKDKRWLRYTVASIFFFICVLLGVWAVLSSNAQREVDRRERQELTQMIERDRQAMTQMIEGFQKKLSEEQIDEKKILLGLQYAYEWDHYKASAPDKVQDMWRIIDEPIKANYSPGERRLLLIVENRNERRSLKNVFFYVTFQDDGLNVRADKGDWQALIPNKNYYVRLGDINSEQAMNSEGNLWIKFPKPGVYKVSSVINGDNFKNILRNFQVDLRGN